MIAKSAAKVTSITKRVRLAVDGINEVIVETLITVVSTGVVVVEKTPVVAINVVVIS